MEERQGVPKGAHAIGVTRIPVIPGAHGGASVPGGGGAALRIVVDGAGRVVVDVTGTPPPCTIEASRDHDTNALTLVLCFLDPP